MNYNVRRDTMRLMNGLFTDTACWTISTMVMMNFSVLNYDTRKNAFGLENTPYAIRWMAIRRQ
jgi:hypothetical protein